MAMIQAKNPITVAYSNFREVYEGNLDPIWNVGKLLTFYTFRDKLSIQMQEYNPRDLLYPEDEKWEQ